MGDPPPHPPAPPGGGAGGTPPGPVRKQLKITNYEHVRHVILKPVDKDVKLTSLNPFVISKYIENIVGPEPKVNNNRVLNAQMQKPRTNYTPCRSGDIIVHTPDSTATKKLLKETKFGFKNITAIILIGMNTVKGVINMRGFNNMSEEEIVHEMKGTGVIAVRHFS